MDARLLADTTFLGRRNDGARLAERKKPEEQKYKACFSVFRENKRKYMMILFNHENPRS